MNGIAAAGRIAGGIAAFVAAVLVGAGLPPAAVAQDMMQLEEPAKDYTLGGFHYSPPQTDGWRQIANFRSSLSLVYATQKQNDDGTVDEAINTDFGVAMEAHDIPENAIVDSPAALAATSLEQMAAARKSDLVGKSGIEPVPSIPDMYTYRLLVHAPKPEMPDAYEVYYVMMSPDRKQYLVIQCITKTQDYGGQLYFNEFYGSLASIKYTAGEAADARPAQAADKASAGGPKADDSAKKPAAAAGAAKTDGGGAKTDGGGAKKDAGAAKKDAAPAAH